jgi:hypothetical protein
MFLTPEQADVIIAAKIVFGIVVGMVAAFILHALRPVGKRWLLPGAAIGMASFIAGILLTGWASDWTGHAGPLRTWFASQEISFPLLLTLCLVGLHHLWLTAHRRSR